MQAKYRASNGKSFNSYEDYLLDLLKEESKIVLIREKDRVYEAGNSRFLKYPRLKEAREAANIEWLMEHSVTGIEME